MYQVPSVVETLEKTNPASLFVTVTFAPGTTDPVESVTAPVIVAVPVDDWAKRLAANRPQAKMRRKYIRKPTSSGRMLSMKNRGCQLRIIGRAHASGRVSRHLHANVELIGVDGFVPDFDLATI